MIDILQYLIRRLYPNKRWLLNLQMMYHLSLSTVKFEFCKRILATLPNTLNQKWQLTEPKPQHLNQIQATLFKYFI